MGSDLNPGQDVETMGGDWRGLRLQDYSHLAIRPFDIGDCGRKRFFDKLGKFRRGFIEEGGVSRQFCQVLPPQEQWTPGMLSTVQAMSYELEKLADALRREAGRCDQIAAELQTHLEHCGALKAPGQPELPKAKPDPRWRPYSPPLPAVVEEA